MSPPTIELTDCLNAAERVLLRGEAERDLLARQRAVAQQALDATADDITELGSVVDVLATLAKLKQEEATHRIERLVARGLNAVFYDLDLDFKLVWDRSRTAMTCTPCLMESGSPARIFDCAGGGVADVVGFCLRAVSIVLMRPRVARVLVVDEPFGDVRGRRYQERLGQLLQMLREVTGLQMIIVSDVGSTEVLREYADLVLHVEKKNGRSVWKRV